LGVAVGAPLYVIELDAAKNRVVVGQDRDLFRSRFLVRDVNWIRPLAAGDAVEAHVKIRHNHPGAAARVEAYQGSVARVKFLEPQRAITPGQAAVFYADDEVLGGGWISQVS
jgi:tRNA-specific 2-thiouridylase